MITTVGIGLAKSVFQVHAVDQHGKVVLKKQLKLGQMAEFFVALPTCLIGMEACGSAHYWARKLHALGHTMKLMAPQFVKPYVKMRHLSDGLSGCLNHVAKGFAVWNDFNTYANLTRAVAVFQLEEQGDKGDGAPANAAPACPPRRAPARPARIGTHALAKSLPADWRRSGRGVAGFVDDRFARSAIGSGMPFRTEGRAAGNHAGVVAAAAMRTVPPRRSRAA
jgi:hypothetical protein